MLRVELSGYPAGNGDEAVFATVRLARRSASQSRWWGLERRKRQEAIWSKKGLSPAAPRTDRALPDADRAVQGKRAGGVDARDSTFVRPHSPLPGSSLTNIAGQKTMSGGGFCQRGRCRVCAAEGSVLDIGSPNVPKPGNGPGYFKTPPQSVGHSSVSCSSDRPNRFM
jgi:hypothetical protein